jgi:hypothetical protein
MRHLYFVSFCAPNGVFGYTHVDTSQRIHNYNIEKVQEFIEKKYKLKSAVIINYKRIWIAGKNPKETK